MKNIVVLGSTGSVGVNTLKVLRQHRDKFRLVGLTANSNVELLIRQAKEFRPRLVAINNKIGASIAKARLSNSKIDILSGSEGLSEVAAYPDVDIVVVAISGSSALLPTLAAIEKGKRTIALACKEVLVMAGQIVTSKAKRKGVNIIPVDSEHSAIFQCLENRSPSLIRRIYLTGSGGPLLNMPRRRFLHLTPEEVINHPKWKMGKKISVDSATLMNKGLEVIEAKWLFGIDSKDIDVLIHPQAIVHSMIEFVDGCIVAQLAITDMRLPIQYALTYPNRFPTSLKFIDFLKLEGLSFDKPDKSRFPCLGIAYNVAKYNSTSSAVLNAADEVVVAAFLEKRARFIQIPSIIEKVLQVHRAIDNPTLSQILDADAWARYEATRRLNL